MILFIANIAKLKVKKESKATSRRNLIFNAILQSLKKDFNLFYANYRVTHGKFFLITNDEIVSK